MKTQTPTTAFPLQWPEGWPRAKYQIRSRFSEKLTISKAHKRLSEEVRRFDGQGLIISTNLELNNDGETPRSKQRQPGDCGVAIYFQKELDGTKEQVAIPCDTYYNVEENLWAIAMTIEYLRGIERHGAGQLMKAAFQGFLALPDPNARPWYEVLEVYQYAPSDVVTQAYRSKAREFHPDNNPGDAEAYEYFLKVQAAWEEYEQITGA